LVNAVSGEPLAAGVDQQLHVGVGVEQRLDAYDPSVVMSCMRPTLVAPRPRTG